MNITTKTAVASVAPAPNDSSPWGEFDVILSTSALDRDGEELHPHEWKTPLPEHITFDSDHGMSVATTVGSGRPFINDAGQLQVRGSFASTDHAQNVRKLVNEGHIRSVSVSFLSHPKTTKGHAVGVERELLNGAFVAVPANPEAIVLSSKSAKEPYGDVPYADPGFRGGVKRYPIDTAEHVRSAWDFFHHRRDRDKYTDAEQAHITHAIERAARRFGVHLTKGVQRMVNRKDADAPHADANFRYDAPFYPPTPPGRYPDVSDRIPRDAIGDSDAYDQLIHDLAVTLGARCPGVDAHAGLTDGAPAYGKGVKRADAPHATADAGGQVGRYTGALLTPSGRGDGRISGWAPDYADGASNARDTDLQTVHDLAVRLGAACTDDYATHGVPQGANGSSDANDSLHGVQAVLRVGPQAGGFFDDSTSHLESVDPYNKTAKPSRPGGGPPVAGGDPGTQLLNGMHVTPSLGLGTSPDDRYPHLQMIHDAAVQLGGICSPMATTPPWAEDGEVWGANSPVIDAPITDGGAKSVAALLKWASEVTSEAVDDADATAKALLVKLNAIA